MERGRITARVIAAVTLAHKNSDRLTRRRLMTSHRTPAQRIVEPVAADARRRTANRIEPIPRLDDGRAVPLPADVQAHAERVLERPIPSRRRDIRPAAGAVLLRELYRDAIAAEVDRRDRRRHV